MIDGVRLALEPPFRVPRLPFLTADLAAVGGVFRPWSGDHSAVEDFEVEELPLYRPCGEGEHLYLWIEKRHLSTPQAIRIITKILQVPEGNVGYAGLKDARAVSRQWISVPRLPGIDERLAALTDADPRFRVLESARHRNKLRLGHAAGNRFQVVLRGLDAEAGFRARAIVDRLAKRGVPHFFGAQRFGRHANSHLIGRALLLGDWVEALTQIHRGEERVFPITDAESARAQVLRRPLPLLKLWPSAWQGYLFNLDLVERLDMIDQPEDGLWMTRQDNGACFIHRDGDPVGEHGPVAERLARGEISPTAPLFGYKVDLSEGQPGERERAWLEASGVDAERYRRPFPRGDYPGERRPLRFLPSDFSWRAEEDRLILRFTAPPGAYATQVVREFTRDERL